MECSYLLTVTVAASAAFSPLGNSQTQSKRALRTSRAVFLCSSGQRLCFIGNLLASTLGNTVLPLPLPKVFLCKRLCQKSRQNT
jgi:hypothetical protein